MFINKFFNFNLSKDFFCFSCFFIPMTTYFFESKFKIIFFSKSAFFNLYNFFKFIKFENPKMFIVRLFLKGVGYKILRSRKQTYNHVYRFELGYSVVRYFFVPKNVYSRHKRDRLIIFGSVKKFVVSTAKLLIDLKVPDVYKGKGVRDAIYTFKPKPGKQRLSKVFFEFSYQNAC